MNGWSLLGKPGWSLRVLHTPGHARGHVCIFEETNGSLITGDLMAGFGTVVIDPPEGHMATYFDSLRRMLALHVTAFFPAHGPVMANAKAKIQEYLDHRLERESEDPRSVAAREPGTWRDCETGLYRCRAGDAWTGGEISYGSPREVEGRATDLKDGTQKAQEAQKIVLPISCASCAFCVPSFLHRRLRCLPAADPGPISFKPEAKAVEVEVNDGSRVQRQELAHHESADDGYTQRPRSSEPVPVPSASGNPPSMAAIVVIVIGRKRSRHAW